MEGDEGDNFYMVEEGEVECLKFADPETSVEGGDEEYVHVRDLSVGDHFGELALLQEVKRYLSVRVKSTTAKLLYMDRSDFNRILGNINKYLKKDYDGVFDTKFSTIRHRIGENIFENGVEN